MSKLHTEDPKPKAVIKIQEEAEKQYAQEYALLKQLTDVKTAKQIFSKFFQVFLHILLNRCYELGMVILFFAPFFLIVRKKATSNRSPRSKIHKFCD